jgi:diguanylate cyclase
MKPFIAGVLMLASMFAASTLASDFDAKIRAAEIVKSSKPERFNALLEELEGIEGLTPAQRDHIGLLQAYKKAITGNSDGSIAQLRQILDSKNDLEISFRAGTLLANTLAVNRKFKESLRALDEALPLQSHVSDHDYLQSGLVAAGVVYNQVGAYGLAEEYARRVVNDSPSPRNACSSNNLLLEAAQEQGRKLPHEDFDRAVAACGALGEGIFANIARTFAIRDLYQSGQRGQAIAMLEKHLYEVRKLGYPRLTGEFESMLSEYKLAQGDQASAEEHAQLALAVSASMVNTKPLVVAYKTLYEIAESRGQSQLALERFKQYAEADKSYLTDMRDRQMAYQIVRQDLLQKSQQIESLNQQNQLLQLQQQVDKQSAQNARLVVLLMLLVCGFVGYWAYKVKRVQMSLRRWAETDALTQVSNRHSFSQSGREVLNEAARDGEEVAMVMFDLDHFKSINDRFGHGTGDWVLKEVAEVCRSFCRRVDKIGRLGGEEFAFLLRGYDARSAVRLSDDCRARLASIETEPSGHNFVVTGSFGVSTTALSGYDLTRLLSHADSALYRAKREGRNRVYLYEAGTVTVEAQLAEGAADNVVPLKLEPAARA